MTEVRSPRPRRSWSEPEKRALLRQALELVADGTSWETAARALDVWPSSLSRWRDQFGSEDSGFREVELVDTSIEPPQSGGVCITTPEGFYIEGLDVGGAVTLLESLRCSG